MASVVYALCAIASIVCTWVLLRSYRRNRTRLLLWCSLCFAGLALNNITLFIDLVVLPHEVSLATFRAVFATTGLGLMLYGLIWETV